MIIRTPPASPADLPASLARALTVLCLGLEMLDQPTVDRRPADFDGLTDAIAAATLQVLDRRRLLPLW